MAKKFNFYNELNQILIDVFQSGTKRTPIQPVLDNAHNRIMNLLDKNEIVRMFDIAISSEKFNDTH